MTFRHYPAYKWSGVDWLGQIPSHWEVGRLKFSATSQTSNVDKHVIDDELAVQLCNYVDVYKNEYITADVDFMQGSATPAEIAKFSLREGDVIITKDSESWEDIAVPASVQCNLDNVLCGYHLAMIRSQPGIFDDRYLFRLFCSEMVNYQFKISANGVTRFGLPASAINNALLLRPPLPGQRDIARFIERETARVDAFIQKKGRLLELLEEKESATISEIVTQGMNRSAPKSPSGDFIKDCIAFVT